MIDEVYITACVYTRRIPLRACVRVCVRSLLIGCIKFYVPKSCQSIAIPKMGKVSQNGKKHVHLFSFIRGCHNICTYNSCIYNNPLACLLRVRAIVYCVRDCLLRVRACACVTACHGLIHLSSITFSLVT